jgi:hypothetical protein
MKLKDLNTCKKVIKSQFNLLEKIEMEMARDEAIDAKNQKLRENKLLVQKMKEIVKLFD